MLVKKNSKNQLTLPKEIADRFPGAEYFDVQVKGRAILLRPVRIEPEDDDSGIEAIREKVRRMRLTEKDVVKAVEWARRKKFMGIVESNVPDLGETHREHLRRRFRRD